MKTKTLAQIDGIIGLITGIILAILPFVIVMIAGISEDEDAAAVIVGMMFIAFALVKIAILILGILTLIYYKDDKRITLAPSILFIVGSVVSLIPFLGWIGGIVIIIGAALYLSSLKQFQIQE
jgi:integral membrane protein